MVWIFFCSGNIPWSSHLIMEYKRYVQRNNQYLDFPDEVEVFMIVFDVSFLKEEELAIEFLEENTFKVSLKHGFRGTGNISFSRDCTYVYTLPENVNTTNLVAYWSEDSFLVIKEKRTGETEIAAKARGGTGEHELKSDRILIFSAAANKNGEKMKQEKPSNESSETTVMQDGQFTSPSTGSEEMLIEERKSTNASSKSWENPMQDRVSTSASVEIDDKMQEPKSIDLSNTVQATSRLIPVKVRNRFSRMLSESNLQDAMNDIQKRMNFVNEFLDGHIFEKLH